MEWWDYASIVGGVAGIAWLLLRIFSGNDERVEEDSARRFFDEHGHWPDEDPAEANHRYEL
jgi:hypothetical protein